MKLFLKIQIILGSLFLQLLEKQLQPFFSLLVIKETTHEKLELNRFNL